MTRTLTAAAAFGTVALAAVLTGCGGDTTDTAAPTQTSAPTTTRPATETVAQNTKALTWIRQTYAGTTWVGAIVAIEDRFGTADWVTTSLPPGDERGKAICSAVSAYQISELGEFKGVTVRAADGQRLSLRKSVNEEC